MKKNKCPKCYVEWFDKEGYGKNHYGIENPYLYDGVSFYKCTNCNTYFDRWTMEELSKEEYKRKNDEV